MLDRKELSLVTLLQVFRWKIGLTWILTILETGLMALIPLFIGLAIDGLMTRAFEPLYILCGVLAALLIGSIGGVIIGAIPGVGAAVAIAILLPATFAMDPIVGLTVLLGIYGSSMYGGAIPAILINTPGTAVNALTSYDGHPMTQKGDAHRALSLAYSASFWGGIFGIGCLILLSPGWARVAPMFGSREIFLAALLGVVLVILAHRGQIFAAGVLAMFGIFLQTIGLDAVTYTQRYTFGLTFLSSGVNLIVVVLGLFALSQAFFLLTAPDNSPDAKPVSGRMSAGIRELMRHKRVATVASGCGVILGMIPGTGEFTAQFMSYTYAQKTSKTPDLFGKGSPEGLIASEAANNAVPAAAMIPLLALGVPGDVITGVMLGAFMIQGLTPGPLLFQTNIHEVYMLLIGMLVSSVLLFFAGKATMRMFAKVSYIPQTLLTPLVLLLCIFGIYSIASSTFDVAVLLVMGLVGSGMFLLNIPAAPFLIAFILGPMLEENLRRALAISRGDPAVLLSSPITWIFAVLIVFALSFTLRREIRKSKTERQVSQ